MKGYASLTVRFLLHRGRRPYRTQTGSRYATAYSIVLGVIHSSIGQVMEPVAKPYKARSSPITLAGFALSDAIVYNAEEFQFCAGN
jgi:hypothetical protein